MKKICLVLVALLTLNVTTLGVDANTKFGKATFKYNMFRALSADPASNTDFELFTVDYGFDNGYTESHLGNLDFNNIGLGTFIEGAEFPITSLSGILLKKSRFTEPTVTLGFQNTQFTQNGTEITYAPGEGTTVKNGKVKVKYVGMAASVYLISYSATLKNVEKTVGENSPVNVDLNIEGQIAFTTDDISSP